jgi:hypothetical protein
MARLVSRKPRPTEQESGLYASPVVERPSVFAESLRRGIDEPHDRRDIWENEQLRSVSVVERSNDDGLYSTIGMAMPTILRSEGPDSAFDSDPFGLGVFMSYR